MALEQTQTQSKTLSQIDLLKTIFAAVNISYREVFRGIKVENCKIEHINFHNNGYAVRLKCSRIEIRIESRNDQVVVIIGKKEIELPGWIEYTEDKALVIHY